MRALKYFDTNTLYSLEDTLFGDTSSLGKLTYCLINEHQKVFYLAETVSVAGLIARLRLAVMKADYSVLAHFLQSSACVSQMSDWTIAIFKPNVMVGYAINQMHKFGFEQIFAADPYEVHSRDTASLVHGYNNRRNVAVYFTTINDIEDKNAMVKRAKQVLETRAKHLIAWSWNKPDNPNHAYYEKVCIAKDHTYADEWIFRKMPVTQVPTMAEVKEYNHTIALQNG